MVLIRDTHCAQSTPLTKLAHRVGAPDGGLAKGAREKVSFVNQGRQTMQHAAAAHIRSSLSSSTHSWCRLVEYITGQWG